MPVYTINGKEIETEKELTDAQIEEIAKEIGGGVNKKLPISSQIPGASQDPAYYQSKPERTGLFGMPQSTLDRMGQNAMAGAMAVPAMAGLAGGVNFLARGSRAAPYAQNLLQATLPRSAGQLAREGLVGAGAGVVAGETGQAVANKMGEQYRPLGDLIGGVGGGLAMNTVAGGGKLLVDTVKAGRGLFNQKGEVERVGGLLGSYNAQNKWRAALEANPDLGPNMLRADEIEALTGINLPITAAAKGDETVKVLLQGQISRQENATFRQELANQEKAAKAAVVAAQRRLSANPRSVEAYAELQAAKENAVAISARTKLELAKDKREAGLDRINNRITELSDEIYNAGQGKTDVGERITNLVKAREAAVKKEFEPLYSDVVKEGMETGAKMPAENLGAIQAFIESEGAKRVFETMPRLSKVINGVLKTKQAQREGNELFGDFPIEGVTRDTPKGGFFLNAQEADSLKRAVNEALRELPSGSADRRIVSELKRLTDEGLGAMGDFGAKLKTIDQNYRIKVGEPFLDANGVAAIDKATFVERTVPLLTGNASSLRQIKNAVGDAPGFNEILNDAWLFKIGNTRSLFKATENGMELNPVQLERFMKANKEAIAEVPGLEANLRGIAGKVNVLRENRTKLLEAQKQGSIENFEKTLKANQSLWQEATQTPGGIVGYVEKALRTPEEMSALMATAGSNRVAQEGIKSAALEAAMQSPNRVEFMLNHSKAFDKLFGAGYTKEVTALLEAVDSLAKYPMKGGVNLGASKSTGFEQATGTKPTQALAELRNPVMGHFRAMMNNVSRFIRNQSDKTEDMEIQNLLRNRKAVSDATRAIKDIEEEAARLGGLGQKAARYAAGFAKNAAFAGFFGGAAGVGLGLTDTLERAKKPEYAEEE